MQTSGIPQALLSRIQFKGFNPYWYWNHGNSLCLDSIVPLIPSYVQKSPVPVSLSKLTRFRFKLFLRYVHTENSYKYNTRNIDYCDKTVPNNHVII